MYTVGSYPGTSNLRTPPATASNFIRSGGATSFLVGFTTSYASSNLGVRQVARYGAFAPGPTGDEDNTFLSAFAVLWGPGQRGMVAIANITPKWNGGNPVPPYGNGGSPT
jgi:hypothetical protein